MKIDLKDPLHPAEAKGKISNHEHQRKFSLSLGVNVPFEFFILCTFVIGKGVDSILCQIHRVLRAQTFNVAFY